MKIADIALPVPSLNNFSYILDEDCGDITGCRVLAPFGPKRELTGVVVRIVDIGEQKRAGDEKLKPVKKILDSSRFFPEDLFSLAAYISKRYYVSQGEAFSAMISPKALPPSRKRKEKEIFGPVTLHYQPTQEQKAVIDSVIPRIIEKKYSENLIFGVSDSGKTEIYLQLIAEALKNGRSAVYLVPEIALIPQAEKHLLQRFGSVVSVFHHRMTPLARYESWVSCLEGKTKIILGARSAVFCPLKDIGVIVIDEEHSDSYRQDRAPAYFLHDIARFRAKASNAAIIYGSATPSLETVHRIKTLSGGFYRLKEKISGVKNDLVVVDLKTEKMAGQFISLRLKEAVAECLRKKEQVILFINRRGYYRFYHCFNCGGSIKCGDCSVSLVFHQDENKMKCHMCGRVFTVPEKCPACGNVKMKFMGYGTERIEDEIKKLFPAARVVRIDRDISSKKGFFDEFYRLFRENEVDIGVGTQILVKGFDFPGVTLTGVIFLDAMFNMPDFSAIEKSVALTVQAAGRSGRGSSPAMTIVQTMNPENPALKYIVPGGYELFIKEEMERRERAGYPPYSEFVRIIFSEFDKKKAEIQAEEFYEALIKRHGSCLPDSGFKNITIYPVCAPFYEKVAKKFRFQVVLRGPGETINSFLLPYAEFFMKCRSRGVHAEVSPSDLL